MIDVRHCRRDVQMQTFSLSPEIPFASGDRYPVLPSAAAVDLQLSTTNRKVAFAVDAEYKLADMFADVSACICGRVRVVHVHGRVRKCIHSNVRPRTHLCAFMETFSSARLCCAAVHTIISSPRRTAGREGESS